MEILFVVIGTAAIFIAALCGGWLLSSAIDKRIGARPDAKVYLYAFLKMALASAGFWLGILGICYLIAISFSALHTIF